MGACVRLQGTTAQGEDSITACKKLDDQNGNVLLVYPKRGKTIISVDGANATLKSVPFSEFFNIALSGHEDPFDVAHLQVRKLQWCTVCGKVAGPTTERHKCRCPRHKNHVVCRGVMVKGKVKTHCFVFELPESAEDRQTGVAQALRRTAPDFLDVKMENEVLKTRIRALEAGSGGTSHPRLRRTARCRV